MVLAVGVVLAARFHLFDRGRTTPVPVAVVVERYQASSSSAADADVPATSPTPGPSAAAPEADALPDAGVYVYTTSGRDSVDALAGDHHDYPAVTTITVTAQGCGALQRWDVAAERWSTSTRCLVSGGVTITASQGFYRFFGQDQFDDYTCTGEPRPLRAPAGTVWTFACGDDDSHDAATGTVIGAEQRWVGGERVDTIHVRVAIDNGTPSDTQVIDTWYLGGRDLIVAETARRVTSSDSVVGTVHYREEYRIELTSLVPRR